MKKIKQLNGHSGCKLFLYKKNNFFFVRKVSSGLLYNDRLFEQYQKQLNWKKNGVVKTPSIIGFGYIDKLFYFDMEYIFGATLSDLLIEGKVGSTEVIDMVVNHYQYQYGNRKTSNDFLYKYDQKINHLNKLKNKYNNFYNLHYSLDLLNSDDWMSGYITYVHGDMTFENVIKCRHTGDMYLIDFLDDFSDNLYTDLSKIFQDLIGQWSFINKSNFLIKKTDVNYAIKLLDIRKNIIGSISSIDDDTDWIKKTMYGLLLNYVRIIPYVKNNKMLEHTDRLLGQAIDIIEKDDYINQLT